MAIDFNARPSGMSKREYAASILGESKENYSGSGQPKSASSSSSKSSSSKTSSISTPKEVKYTDLVDTKPIEKAYGAAKETYLGSLTALKPRYEALYAQLEAEKGLAAEKETALSATEQTQQKVNIAKRGISTDTDNPFFTTEAGKLSKEQNTRSRETALQFAGKRLDISGAESADTRDITTAIANLDLGKATTIGGMIATAKQAAGSLNSAAAERAIQQAQWEKTFAYNKSKDEADRALDMYKLAKSEMTSKNDAYNTAFASLYADAVNPKDGIIPDYTRERIQNQLEIAFPNLKDQITKDIAEKFPNGWENQTSAASRAKPKQTEAQVDLMTKSIDKAIDLSGAAGRSGYRQEFEKNFVGSTDYTNLTAQANTIRTNILTLNTDPIIKKFFGPQMTNKDVELMTAGGTTLNPELQSPEEIKDELIRLKDLMARMKSSVSQGISQGTQGVTSSGLKFKQVE